MTQRGTLLAFGEMILRLSPARGELLLQSPPLDVRVAGAEANVVTQLAHPGDTAALATRLPDNDLGRAALTALRGHGVDVSRIWAASGWDCISTRRARAFARAM